MKRFLILLILIFPFVIIIAGCDSDNDTDDDIPLTFDAKITEIDGDNVVVEILKGHIVDSEYVRFSKTNLEDIDISIGDVVTITHSGFINFTFTPIIYVSSWSIK